MNSDISENESAQLTFLSLNVCGLKSKLLLPEFHDYIQDYDIIGFQETKTDLIDEITLPNFNLYFKHRRKISRRKSGGIAFAYKKELRPHISPIETTSKLVQWFSISDKLIKQSNVLCGVVYIPPESSVYASDDPYQEIEQELHSFSDKYSQVLLFGDLNSRTKTLCDYIHVDNYIFEHVNAPEINSEFNLEMSHFENSTTVMLDRANHDTCVNNYGYKLIDFCKSNSVYIMNGRTIDTTSKHTTCKGSSTVDYFLCTANVIPLITNLNVAEFCPLLSDVHNPVSLNLNVNRNTCNTNRPVNNDTTRLWNDDKTSTYIENIDRNKIDSINSQLSYLQDKVNVTQSDVDYVVTELNASLIDCAKKTFGTRTQSNSHNKDIPFHWFGNQCRKARRNFHRAKYFYKLRKDPVTKVNLKNTSRVYKQTTRKYNTQFKTNQANMLKRLRKSNPRKYWKILNGKKTETTDATITSLYTFFKEVNYDSTSSEMYTSEENINTTNDEINVPFTIEELEKVCKSLNNNKANGDDSVVNEHIKASFKCMSHIYVKLFNIILDSGKVPESWTSGIIKPIYKQKGDSSKPENYRPITLVSCMGKFFTSVINNRLQAYAEKYNLISECQTGFRKGFSTADNIFVLHSLLEILRSHKKKLFCAFVDLKQAFDTVWRSGLWHKLIKANITGKCFNLIKNMYSSIKSCISANGDKSSYFPCNRGVRQGENLSPFLFSLYLNDLEDFLSTRDVTGINCRQHDNEENICVFLKLFILLYADDTVILSETATDLQHAIDQYEQYCNHWKLTVNISKTKVVVFTNTRNNNYQFKYQGNPLEIVPEYKYLGVYLNKNGSFTSTKKHIADQAVKAMYSLLKKSRSLNLPIDMQIELFDKMVKPILLYGSEIWGFANNDIIERVHLKYLKIIFNMKKSTPSFMVYGEAGQVPIHVEIQTRMISFWSRLHNENDRKLSSIFYDIVYSHYKNSGETNNRKFQWISCIKTILIKCGLNDVFVSRLFPNAKWLKFTVKMKLKDLYINEWFKSVAESSSALNYRIFKNKFGFEEYLTKLPYSLRIAFIKFRTRNHRLPVETGRWRKIALNDRKCNLCKREVGDEYHYVLTCENLKQIRKQYIKPYYYVNANTYKFDKLMNTKHYNSLQKLCKFIQIILFMFSPP
ncbi:MAG: reverse transcriptase domain-containing protein [Sedimenticola sp.]